MSVFFPTSAVTKLRDIFSGRKSVKVFDERQSTGYGETIYTRGYRGVFLEVIGSFDAEITIAARDSDGNIYTQTRGDVSGAFLLIHSYDGRHICSPEQKITTSGLYYIETAGYEYISPRVFTYTSGAITVNAYPTQFSMSDKKKDIIQPTQQIFDSQSSDGVEPKHINPEITSAVLHVSGNYNGTFTIEGGPTTNATHTRELYLLDEKGKAIKEVKSGRYNGVTVGDLYHVDLNGIRRLQYFFSDNTSGDISVSVYYSYNPIHINSLLYSRIDGLEEKVKPPETNTGEVRNLGVLPGFGPAREVDISEDANSITIYNDSEYTPVEYWVNIPNTYGSTLAQVEKRSTIYPNEAETVYADSIDSIVISSRFGYGKVRLVTGNNLPNYSYRNSNKKFLIDSFGSRERLRGTSKLGYNLRGVYSNVFVGVDSNDNSKLLYSNDYNENITEYEFAENINANIFVTTNGTILLCSGGDVYRSADGAQTFTKVLENIVQWREHQSIKEKRGIIVFVEYTSGDEGQARIWKSDDDGETWTEVHSESTDNIRHFHTVYYSEYLERWIATSGDENNECFWFWSSGNDAINWTKVPITESGGQIWRTLGQAFFPDGTIVWSTDFTTNNYGNYSGGIFRIHSDDLERTDVDLWNDRDPQILKSLRHEDMYMYPFFQYGDFIISGTRVRTGLHTHVPKLIVSKDRGDTWEIAMEWPKRKDADDSVHGFSYLYGMCSEGYIWISASSLAGSGIDMDRLYGVRIKAIG